MPPYGPPPLLNTDGGAEALFYASPMFHRQLTDGRRMIIAAGTFIKTATGRSGYCPAALGLEIVLPDWRAPRQLYARLLHIKFHVLSPGLELLLWHKTCSADGLVQSEARSNSVACRFRLALLRNILHY